MNNTLEARIAALEIQVRRNSEWNDIPESLKPTSKGRWNQLVEKEQAKEARKLGVFLPEKI